MCYWWPSVNARLYGPFCTNSIGVSARRTLWASCYLASIIVLGYHWKITQELSYYLHNYDIPSLIWHTFLRLWVWQIMWMNLNWDILVWFSTAVYLPGFFGGLKSKKFRFCTRQNLVLMMCHCWQVKPPWMEIQDAWPAEKLGGESSHCPLWPCLVQKSRHSLFSSPTLEDLPLLSYYQQQCSAGDDFIRVHTLVILRL